MIEWAVSSSVLILVVLVLRRLLVGKISLRLQYGLWALVLLRLLLPVSFGATAVSVLNLVDQATIQIQGPAPGHPGEEGPELSIADPDLTLSSSGWQAQREQNREQGQAAGAAGSETDRHASLGTMLLGVWAAGAVALGVWFLWVNLRFAGRLRRSRKLLTADCPLPVYLSGAARTPCLFGLIHPAIYLTEEAAADETALRHSLAHELTHFDHKDHLWAGLRGLCLALHWYNPLAWVAAGLSRRDGELCCDEATVKRLGEKERAAYGRTLLAVTCQGRGSPLLAATNMTGGKKGIQERIWLLAKHPRTPFCSWVGVILVMTMAAGCTFTNSSSSLSEEESSREGGEGNLVWVDGITFSGLAPEEETSGSGEITISTDENEFWYSFTCSHPEVTLEVGLRGRNGTEYTQTVAGESGSGSFRDLPAGIYQLFARNGEKLPERPENQKDPKAPLVSGVINLYQADETSLGKSGGTGFALGYPGASAELNPISWTFSRADIPLLTDALKGSDYLALYLDQEMALRVTSGHVIEISRDGGLTWEEETCETISGEDFSVWLLENEPMPNFSMSDLRERLNNGAEIRHMASAQGKEIYFVLDEEGAFLELVQEEKIQALLLDGQRLACTSTSTRPYLFSESMFEAFQGLLRTCDVMNTSRTEKEWAGVMAHLKEYGAQFS